MKEVRVRSFAIVPHPHRLSCWSSISRNGQKRNYLWDFRWLILRFGWIYFTRWRRRWLRFVYHHVFRVIPLKIRPAMKTSNLTHVRVKPPLWIFLPERGQIFHQICCQTHLFNHLERSDKIRQQLFCKVLFMELSANKNKIAREELSVHFPSFMDAFFCYALLPKDLYTRCHP